MNIRDLVQAAVQEVIRVDETDDGVLVATHCLYPSNDFVQVAVRGGPNEFIVSDEGGAFADIESAGAQIEKPDALVRHLLVSTGMNIVNGVIRSPRVSREVLPIAIALTANASSDVAEWLYTHCKIKRERNFRKIVREFLRKAYDDRVVDETIVGESNKPHKFENVIRLPNDRRLIADAVIHDASSINARVIANLDVRMAKHQGLEQRIVYDDHEEWNPADLNLLQVGATAVPFSKFPEVIARLAA
jgi:hypothetical protein